MTALGELGLSSYEEQVYRTLLVTGAVPARDLADASGVPSGRIYDVLNGLEARRLVRTRSTEPNRYVAVAPATAVDRLLAERTAALRQRWERYRDAANSVRSNLLPSAPTDGSVWLGTLGSEEMATALGEHVQAATSEVRAAVGPPYGSAPWETLSREADAFLDAIGNEVTVSLLLSERVLETVPETFLEAADTHPATVQVRAVPAVGVSFDVVDRSVTTVDIPHPQNGADRIGVISVTDSEVVEAFQRQFRALWSEAVPLVA